LRSRNLWDICSTRRVGLRVVRLLSGLRHRLSGQVTQPPAERSAGLPVGVKVLRRIRPGSKRRLESGIGMIGKINLQAWVLRLDSGDHPAKPRRVSIMA